MSASSQEGALLAGSRDRNQPRSSRQHAADRVFWTAGLLGVGILAGASLLHAKEILSDAPTLLPWIGVMAIANLLPVSGWYSTSLAPDLPIAVAAALILSPLETGLVAFFGALDPKEIRGEIPVRKAVFNRVQVAMTDLVASLVAHAVLSRPSTSVLTLPLAIALLALIVAINAALIGPLISLERGVPLSEVMRRLHPGAPIDLIVTFLAWAVLGAMLVTLYVEINAWALLAFLAPTMLGRQVLARSQMFLDSVRSFQSKEKAFNEISRRIHEERTDERRLIAADLHDEVLQPLFKVSLMAHVIKADLATGRLLEMDEDLPELLSAAEIASGTLRALIGDLRRSTLGRGGLGRALVGLVRALEAESQVQLRTRIEAVRASSEVELVIYQVAKEALTNAMSHAGAEHITVDLAGSDGHLALSVSDDGKGFDPSHHKDGHYGLHIMQERAASIGGTLHVDSFPGKGCTVRLLI